MRVDAEWLQLLRKVSVFSSFTESQLGLVAKRMTLVSFPKGAVLFRENDSGDALYLILSGSIRIIKGLPSSDNSYQNGHPTLAYLGRGDVLGEMALLTAQARPNSAIVDTTSDLLILQKKDFDLLLEKNPALAVHVSRILSKQLASIHRDIPNQAQPGRIFSLVTAIPPADQAVFAINLGLAMAQQTHGKVLLAVVEEGPRLIAKSLGLEMSLLSEAVVRKGFLQDPKKFEQAVMVHPSGLELLTFDMPTFSQSIHPTLFSFLEILKTEYDFCLFLMPAHIHQSLLSTINESNRILLIAGPQSSSEQMQAVRSLEAQSTPGKKWERIWLSENPLTWREDFPATVRFPWDPAWGERLLETGSPFIPSESVIGQRSMERLARSLGQMSIGFAMGSGAAFGYALIGMLRVLEREGIYPDVISGTSMGALIGSFYSNGISPDALEAIATSISKKRLWQMADPIFPRSGLIKGRGVLEFLKAYLGDKSFKDLLLPFSCVATDIQTGQEIILDQGNVAEAVRASLSLPFFFQPYYLNGRYLVDGGLVNPVPTSVIVAQGANILLSANLTSKASERKVPKMIGWWRRRLPKIKLGPSIPETLMKTIYIMQSEISAARSELAHVVMTIKTESLLWWDLDRAKEMIALGEAAAEQVIPKIKSLIPFFADSCKVRLTRKGRKHY